jgi:twitching motility two-component system response regulator PilG
VWFWLAVSSPSAEPAIRYLRRAAELDPAHTPTRDGLSKLLVATALSLASRDRAGAHVLLSEACQVAPNADTVWIALAALSETPAERLDALRRASGLSPHRPELRARLHDAVLHQAVLIAKGGSNVEARRLFREAADLDPRDPRAWQALARLAEKPAEAVRALRELVRVAPDHAGGRAALKTALVADARAQETAGRKKDALARWREAATLDDRDPDVWIGLASSATDQAEVRRAVETAHRLDPAHAGALAWIARLKAPKRTPAAAPQQGGTRGRTVMVVDDSATIRKILALTLQGAGYTVVAEPDGEKAMQRLAELVPDLILLDITMPNLDGYEVCTRIKKDARTSHVPVVMLSGKDGFFDKVKGRMVGATEYLTKPFQAPTVLAVIARHCDPNREVANG